MKRKKGFTLIELIIVLAIFGILLAVLIPSWGYFIQRARIRTQNNRAKANHTIVLIMSYTIRSPL